MVLLNKKGKTLGLADNDFYFRYKLEMVAKHGNASGELTNAESKFRRKVSTEDRFEYHLHQ